MNYWSFHVRIIAPLFLIGAAFAHESQISGTVQDSSGAQVPGAVITTVQEETGTRREACYDTTGAYPVFSVRHGTDTLPRCQVPGSATVNGQPAQVLYAGVAPGLVSGANQINLLLPSGITSAPISIVVTAGTASSKAFSFALP
jgi:uncharacterized protein (TIGR03437 family)